MKKVIFNLSVLVDEVINKTMEEFIALGRQAKAMQLEEKPEREIDVVYSQMSEIFKTLEPFEQRTRNLYPHLAELFDILVNIN